MLKRIIKTALNILNITKPIKNINIDEERKKQREELLKRNFGDTKHPESLFDSYPQPNNGTVEYMVKQEIIDYAIKQMGERDPPKVS